MANHGAFLALLVFSLMRCGKGPAYGLSAEVAAKLEAKKDPALEHEVIEWIKKLTGEDPAPLGEKLNDGLILCKLVNAIKPGIVKVSKRGGRRGEEEGVFLSFLFFFFVLLHLWQAWSRQDAVPQDGEHQPLH